LLFLQQVQWRRRRRRLGKIYGRDRRRRDDQKLTGAFEEATKSFMSVITGERTPSHRLRASDGRAGRIPLEVSVRLRSDAGWCPGVTKNICTGGVFVATLRSFSVGERVAVRLAIPGDAEPVEALAEVRWSRPFQDLDDRPVGLGLRFIDTPLGAARVERIVRLSRIALGC
jgi:uncharacterized protein (TIGR02266 family)